MLEEAKDLAAYQRALHSTCEQELQRLAQYDQWEVRARVGGNKKTDLETLTVLATDRHPVVRANVLSNISISAQTAHNIGGDSISGKDEDWIIRAVYASREDLLPETQLSLFKTSEWYVLLSLVHSASSTSLVLKLLSELPSERTSNLTDRWKEIRDIAENRLSTDHS